MTGSWVGLASVEAVVLRKADFEFPGEFEFNRRFAGWSETTRIWEGAIEGTYKDLPKVGGGILTPVNPSASLKPGHSIRLIKDTLELSEGGEVAPQFNPHNRNVEVGGEISGALKRNLDVFRRLGKR